MKKADWKKIKSLLNEVLEIAPLKRKQFLEENVADENIRQEVESLMMFEEDSEDFISVSAGQYLNEIGNDLKHNNSFIGQKVGILRWSNENGGKSVSFPPV